MVKADISVEHAEGDTNYRICMLACFAAKKSRTAVVAEDSDVFQLMIHHANTSDNNENLYMDTAKQTMCITTLKKKLDPTLSEVLLFLHALGVCDIISRPYRKCDCSNKIYSTE